MSAYNDKFCFIHIPKNAGTSIRRALDFKAFDAIDKKHRIERDPALANHFPYARIEKLIRETKSPVTLANLTSFMVVRNPWERMVSLYFHRMRKLHLSYEGKPRNTAEDIAVAKRGFIPWLLTTPSRGDSVLTKMAQAVWGKNEAGVFVVDHVLRQETLDAEWPAFCRTVGLGFCDLPKVNTGGGESKSYRKHYNPEAARHVEAYFAEDIERWGYEF